MYGFELHIQDKIYGLAADSSSEMESWVKAFCKATGIEIEQEKPLRSLFAGKATHPKFKNLKESLKNSSHPLLQQYAKETDQGNFKLRQANRLPVFSIYPDLYGQTYGPTETSEEETQPFKDVQFTQFILNCKNLRFKLSTDEGRNCEPFFLVVALFDGRIGRKISEDFCFDLNEDVFNMQNGGTSNGNKTEKEKIYHCPKKVIIISSNN